MQVEKRLDKWKNKSSAQDETVHYCKESQKIKTKTTMNFQ